MSTYNDEVETKYLDPKSFIDGRRAVFELKGNHLAILPNLRLIDVGVFGQAGGIYNKLIGADSLIERVTLYDGRTELSKSVQSGLWSGYLSQAISNSPAQSLQSQKSGSQIGFQQLSADRLYQYTVPAVNTQTTRATSDGAYVDLQKLLPFINNLAMMDQALYSDTFANLRLEVDFNTAAVKQILSDTAHTITAQLIPVLAYDVMDDPKIVSAMKKQMPPQMSWFEIEHDEVFFPASANGGAGGDQGLVQEVNSKLDGLRNKYVKRILQVKEINDPSRYLDNAATTVAGLGRYCSCALYQEKIQCRLNGKNIFPRTGMTGNMERLHYLADSWGDSFCYPGASQMDLDAGQLVGSSAAEGKKLSGQLSYNGFFVDANVTDLQITHTRTNLADTSVFQPTNAALRCHYFSEVRKVWSKNKNGFYNVQYS